MSVVVVASRMFASEGGGIAALGVDGKALILQIITFVLVFFLLKKFALSKIIDQLEKRARTINDGVKLGLEMQKAKDELEVKTEEILRKAREQADKIIAAGHADAKELVKAAEAAAAHKTEALLTDAHAKIEEDMVKARKKLEQDMLELVGEATEAVIGEKLDSRKDSAIIERALGGLR
jgi:F-type H+-transporting ATPase subunit b